MAEFNGEDLTILVARRMGCPEYPHCSDDEGPCLACAQAAAIIAALKDRDRLGGSLDKIRAWSHWHKQEARTQLRGTMKLIHDEALAALEGRDG